MPTIKNIRLSAKKSTDAGENWDFTVKYDVTLSTWEVNQHFNFRDSFVLWESDSNPIDQILGHGSDDQLTGLVGASTFKGNAEKIARTLTHRISADALDTDNLPLEDFYAVVRLKNKDTDADVKKTSPILHLNA